MMSKLQIDSQNMVEVVDEALVGSLLIQTGILNIWNTMAYLEYDLGARQRVDRDQCWSVCSL